MSDANVEKFQQQLKDAGHDPGPIDGFMGNHTGSAYTAFAKAQGIPVQKVEIVNSKTMRAIFPFNYAKESAAASPPVLQPLATIVDPPWITQAKSVMGLHEVRDNARLSEFMASDGDFLGDPSEFPWCGDLVHTCIQLALPKEPFPGALGENPYWALNWQLFGEDAPAVPYGCVGVWRRSGGGHVGFIVGKTPDGLWYHVLGGNQSNTVSIAKMPVTSGKGLTFVAARMPVTWGVPDVLPVYEKAGDASGKVT